MQVGGTKNPCWRHSTDDGKGDWTAVRGSPAPPSESHVNHPWLPRHRSLHLCVTDACCSPLPSQLLSFPVGKTRCFSAWASRGLLGYFYSFRVPTWKFIYCARKGTLLSLITTHFEGFQDILFPDSSYRNAPHWGDNTAAGQEPQRCEGPTHQGSHRQN